MLELEILYQDKDLVAINKPSGLLVHKTELDRHEKIFAVQMLRDQLNLHVYPIHRLDKPTSGILMFALNSEMAQEFSTLMFNKQVFKQYIAVTRGWISEKITVDRGIKSDSGKIRRDAITHFTPLAKTEIAHSIGPYESSRYSLIKAVPETGRRHQIRKHLNHISHPILGDTWYGDRDHNRYFENIFGLSTMLLHAQRLQFVHPVSKHNTEIKASLSEDWLKALGILEFKNEILNEL